MKVKLLSIALGIVLSAAVMRASAQKAYTEGIVKYTTEMRGQQADVKQYFRSDSGAMVITFGPATVKILYDAKHTYFAVAIDVPVASIKKVGIATPAELEEGIAAYPNFTFTPSTETKQISGFNCKKVIAKDSKSGKSYDVWITNDISAPSTAFPYYYNSIGGFPVQYTSFQQGQEINITISTVTDEKAPAGTFGVSNDFEKVAMSDLGG
jgi:hypothetical protein